mmetsp:Transcript_35302/g.112321  ORF Transcript_35302/g.112321 Transcript_35302/m.112321 type:complete len:357 (-) Transcript_35302:376-1446(-)
MPLWPKRGCAILGKAVALALAPAALQLAEVSGDDGAGGEPAAPLTGDLWTQLTTEEWQPGRVGEFSTSVPVKDLECEGPQTLIVSDSALQWVVVKERMHEHLSGPFNDPWLLHVAMQIQREEPDSCVLGITSTSAYLLPLTMPKFRNMARMLSTDCNFLVLNVTFYDTLRSGFPIFGILDGLATPEYRAWFGTQEANAFFPPRVAPPSCNAPAARALRGEIERGRVEPSWRAPLLLSADVFAAGDACGKTEAEGGCPLATAAALIVYALARAEDEAPPGSEAVEAALRDVIELVSRAEEIIRSYSWDEGVAFGELVATPWHLWWLLQRLQLALPPLLGPEGGWKRHSQHDASRREL